MLVFRKLIYLTTILFLGIVIFIIPRPAGAATITSLSSTILTPGSTQLTITGSGFGTYNSAGDKVCFNCLDSGYSYPGLCVSYGSADIISWSNTTIVVNVPSDSSGIMVGGRIYVYTDNTKNDGPYYHVQPVITAVSPTSAYVGDQVTITGKYLKDALGGAAGASYYLYIFFNGVAAPSATTWTNSQINIAVPAGASSGAVSIKLAFADGSAEVTATGPAIEISGGISGDSYSPLQTYIQQVKINEAWSLVPKRHGPIVAIIDDGVYVNHPDLRNNIWINGNEIIGNNGDDDKNGYIDDVYGWNYITNNGEMTTRGAHGTMVAGIIGAVGNNGIGITGINPNVRIMPLIVCDKDTGCSTQAIIKAVHYAVDNGAKIINMSLSTWATTGLTSEFNSAVKYAYERGVVIVAAAGNGDVEGGIGQDLNMIPQSPVCNEGANFILIGVGAVTADNYLTTWSNYGTKCVDAYAPGVDIVTTAVPAYSSFGDFYDKGSGTSFAAPIITGIVSLLIQKYPTMPINEIFTRLWRNVDSSVINAYKLLSDPYSPKVLGQALGTSVIVTGTKKGGGPEVRIFTTAGKLLKSFNAYDKNFRGGINVAIGDINDDGKSEIVTSMLQGGNSTIKIFTIEGKSLKLDYFAYDKTYSGGVSLALADLNSDGRAEIITAPMSGTKPDIRIFGLSNGKIVRVMPNFLAYDKSFRGGIAVSAGDLDGDEIPEIITVPLSGGGPQIRIFSFRNKQYRPINSGIMAYASNFRGGVNLAAGDVNGDGKVEIMTGIVKSGGPQVRVFGFGQNNKFGLVKAGFMAYDKNFRGGISVASVDINHDGTNEIITGVGGNSNPTVRIFSQSGKQVSKEFNAYSKSYQGGITLAAGYL